MVKNAVIAILSHEHEIIQMVVKGLAAASVGLRNGRPVDSALLRQAVGFLREFADKCHHGKEEDLLFPAMERRGLPSTAGPTAVMRAEHEQARKCVAAFADAVERYARMDGAAASDVAAAIDCICSLYPNHIWKEDNVLFPMTDHLLTTADIADLRARFDAVEAAMGEDVHERWAEFANIIESAFGAAPSSEPEPGCPRAAE